MGIPGAFSELYNLYGDGNRNSVALIQTIQKTLEEGTMIKVIDSVSSTQRRAQLSHFWSSVVMVSSCLILKASSLDSLHKPNF